MEGRGRMGSKFLAHGMLPSDYTSTTGAVFRDMIKYTPCMQNIAFRGSTAGSVKQEQTKSNSLWLSNGLLLNFPKLKEL
jgi:hypothetical protein